MPKEQNQNLALNASEEQQNSYSAEEVRKHCTESDLWLIRYGKVYNLTPYYKSHPGGKAMLKWAGKDVSSVLCTVPAHSFSANFIERKLAELCIGTVAK